MGEPSRREFPAYVAACFISVSAVHVSESHGVKPGKGWRLASLVFVLIWMWLFSWAADA
jgi:hypothetical protein